MNKTGLKTFVCSFVITLSAILGADRAFFYTPRTAEDNVHIPRKNIALFFSRNHSRIAPLRVEPVQKLALQEAKVEAQEIKIAQNIPQTLPSALIKDTSVFENDEIPLQETASPENKRAENPSAIENMPLIYAGVEKNVVSLASAQREDEIQKPSVVENKIEEKAIQLASVELEKQPERLSEPQVSLGKVMQSDDLLSNPITIKGTRQIVKIDNFKKRQERLAAKAKSSPQEDVGSIPIQNSQVASAEPVKMIEPEPNQVASLAEDISQPQASMAKTPEKEVKKHWQTMAERRQDENPWVVARGSKFVKNKKLLEEDFASEKAAAQFGKLNKIGEKSKTAKVAVQDNLLIPIPRELLKEDNLIPSLGDKKTSKSKSKVVEKEEGSLLDSIASVFSKENREKAIKNLKEKSNKLLKSEDKAAEEARPQILPTEIRLSFQPNRAEISGQTLRWIQAFAKKAVDESNVGLEIRIDGSGAFALQQKRLNLLYNILTANAVDYQKINTVFVEREPNSFVVRTVKITNGADQQKKDDRWKKYYQQW